MITLNKPVFYDADCLESFLFVDAGYILEELFSKIIIPEQVFNEIMDVATPDFVKENFEKLKEGFVEIHEISFASPEYSAYKSIENGFWSETGKICGPGESAVMALAHLNNGIVASNNLCDVGEYVGNLDIELITSSMILSKAFEEQIVSKEEANILWIGMLDNGLILPKHSFLDYYSELYNIDCEKFLKSD